MSYILDALRKSERERASKVLRKLHTPGERDAGDRRVMQVLVVVLVLLVGLLAGMAWWYRATIAALVHGEPSPTTRVAPVPAAVLDSTRIPDEPADAAADAAPRPADPPSSPTPSSPPAPSTPGESTATGGGTTAPSAAASTPAGPVASLPAELRSRLPPLKISVLSFSADPARRFVMIDGGIFREGESLPQGIRVERIDRDRVELSLLNERFFITP